MQRNVIPVWLLACLASFVTTTITWADEPDGQVTEEKNNQGGWTHLRVHDRFYTEDSCSGDIDGDGKIDVVAGPFWFAGPDFTQKHSIAEPRDFPVAGYSDQFFSQTLDANQDGALDVLSIGFPGKEARLYFNPGKDGLEDRWQSVTVADIVDNESPRITQLVGDAFPELVCGRQGQYGYYAPGTDATKAWQWHPISRPGTCEGRFAHGLGVGDVNGDGRLDVLDRHHWWEQPEKTTADGMWTQHRWATQDFPGGAQIHTADIDGDGDQDLVTSLAAHSYGLAWFEQTPPGESSEEPVFVRHDIIGQSSADNPFGVAFSQLHAVDLIDMDGDGDKDIVTGKRWMAHGGKDPGGLHEPVLYWFELTQTDSGPLFIPHLIDRNSGVGVDVEVVDLNQDGRPDVVTSSKKGLIVHLQTQDASGTR